MADRTQDDLPPNIAESTRLLSAVLVLLIAPYTINVDRLFILSNCTDIDNDGETNVMTIRFRIRK